MVILIFLCYHPLRLFTYTIQLFLVMCIPYAVETILPYIMRLESRNADAISLVFPILRTSGPYPCTTVMDFEIFPVYNLFPL
jgi:hypothetical protein